MKNEYAEYACRYHESAEAPRLDRVFRQMVFDRLESRHLAEQNRFEVRFYSRAIVRKETGSWIGTWRAKGDRLLLLAFPHQFPGNNVPLWADALLGLLFPRVLILIYIYQNMGYDNIWFAVHLVVAVLAYFGGGRATNNRRRRRQEA